MICEKATLLGKKKKNKRAGFQNHFMDLMLNLPRVFLEEQCSLGHLLCVYITHPAPSPALFSFGNIPGKHMLCFETTTMLGFPICL
jgi:hypothetical protein